MTQSLATFSERSRFAIHSKLELKAMKFGMGLMTIKDTEVLRGTDGLEKLADRVSELGLNSTLVVTTPGSIKRGYVNRMTDALDKHGISYAIYDGVNPDPTYSDVRGGLELCKNNNCDGVIALGGGSVLDASKAIVVGATNDKPVDKLMGIRKGRNKPLPLFAIPTTSGTASEVSTAAVISEDETHTKRFLVDTRTVAKVAVLDPSLSSSLPPSITAETGMDALTHAFESYISRLSTPESEVIAAQCIEDIFTQLPIAYKDGSDLDARQAMAEASMNAGIAFRTSLLGYVHAISHQIGAIYGIPHGLGNAMVLPHVLEYSKDAIAQKLAKLAIKMELGDATQSESALAQLVIDKVKALNTEMSVPTRVEKLKQTDISEIAQRAYDEALDMHAGPKYMGKKDIEALLNKLL